MRIIPSLLSAAAIAAVYSFSAVAEEEHDHDHAEKVAGPNGGRVITSVEPHLEFFVTKDRKVQLTFLDDHNKPKEVADANLKLTGGKRLTPTRMKFTLEKGAYVSDKTLPEGNMIPIVLQIKTDKKAKKITEKFDLNLSDCPSCKYLEYACICDHSHDDHEHDKDGHDDDAKKK
ncbi:MAG: hypothetical protein ACI9R3_005323 [Verrucomicrobiales bacterium]|jgi:hypothetical protein